MAEGYDEVMCNKGEAATSRKQRLNITNPKDLTHAAPSLPFSPHQITTSEAHEPPQDTLPSPALLHDLIVEILLRLPVKSLLRLRCVCKSWKLAISDPRFAKKHLKMSLINPKFAHFRLILSFWEPTFSVKSCSVEPIYSNQPIRAMNLKFPLSRITYDMIVGSCNGLICFSNDQNHVLIWNPSIRMFKKSPDLDNNIGWKECYTVYGFGYDHINDRYKAVAVFCSPHSRSPGGYRTKVKVFDPSTDYWRVIQPLPAGIVPEDDYLGVYVSGTLNWLVWSGTSWAFVSLNLSNETYQQIMLPDLETDKYVELFDLAGLRDCLCVFCHYGRGTPVDVWFMKDYGVKESWTKFFTIPLSLDPQGASVPLFISGNGEVLLEIDGSLVLYNPRDATSKHCKIQGINHGFEALVYVESLISPISICN